MGCARAYIKWFLQKLGHEGLNNLLAAYEDKTSGVRAVFICVMCGAGQPVRLFDALPP